MSLKTSDWIICYSKNWEYNASYILYKLHKLRLKSSGLAEIHFRVCLVCSSLRLPQDPVLSLSDYRFRFLHSLLVFSSSFIFAFFLPSPFSFLFSMWMQFMLFLCSDFSLDCYFFILLFLLDFQVNELLCSYSNFIFCSNYLLIISIWLLSSTFIESHLFSALWIPIGNYLMPQLRRSKTLLFLYLLPLASPC